MRRTDQQLQPAQRRPRARPGAGRACRPVPPQVEQLETRAVPTTVVLGALKDNTLYESATGALSNGAGARFFAGATDNSSVGVRRGMIAFDLFGHVPPGATINSVSLRLNMSRTISGPQPVGLHRLLAYWGEGASDAAAQEGRGAPAQQGDATWLHRKFDTDHWASPGGDFAPAASATASVGGVGAYTWGSTAQMVADVQSWLDDPDGNFGWAVLGNEAMLGTAKRFDSRENGTAANRPALTIDYTAPAASFLLFPPVATATAGVPVDLYVVALDAYGHVVTDYGGTVYLVSTDPAVPPVPYTFRPEDGGIAHLTDAVTFRTPGPHLLLAIDAAFTAIGLGLYEVA